MLFFVCFYNNVVCSYILIFGMWNEIVRIWIFKYLNLKFYFDLGKYLFW